MTLARPQREPAGSPAQDLLTAVESARRDYDAARSYFNCVSDPGLVDHAVLLLAAAEKRYAYLIQRAREAGLRLDLPPLDGHRS
jgi:hypothetical protein